ncbi:MAG: FecR domain-containing protein, partial [Verrucomicrobiota bacterium]|nr:FecR domain-containing protein [Verrucomicrobiota bacterium]
EETAPVAEQQQPADASGKVFSPMVRIVQLRGACEANNPDTGAYAAAVDNKVYPLGTQFKTGPDGSATLVFSRQESVQVFASTELTVLPSEKDADNRTVRLLSGKVRTNLRENLPEGSFNIETPHAASKSIEGRGEYALSSDANVETLVIKTITGAAQIEGPQYRIPALRAANTVDIQTSLDRSFTRLSSVSGDFAILLDNGESEPVNYGMSPKAVVKIWRENAPVGGRAVISTLVVSPNGIARHRFAYAEGRAEVATGELVAPGGDDKAEEDLPVLLSTEPKTEQKAGAEKEKDADQ